MAAGSIRLQLVTLGGTALDEEVFEVSLPTPQGYIGVFPGHMPLVSLASHGVIKVRKKESDPETLTDYYATNGGIIEITDNVVRVLVDEADSAESISENEAEKALERAKDLLKNATNTVELQKAQELIDRTQVRIQVAGLRRHKRR